MATLRDGLGGEELAQSGLQTGGVNISPYFTGSVTAASGFVGTFTDSNGAIVSVGVGSPASFGAKVQAGTATASAGSVGTVLFGTQFASTTYYLVLSPGSNALANSPGSVVPYLNTQNVSGANFTGAASTNYNWVAVGL